MAGGLTRRQATALMLGGVVAGMGGLAYAAVPLYRLFCQVTGYGGTTRRAEVAPLEVLERKMTIRFDAGTAGSMPWAFGPVKSEIEVRVGEETLAYYRVTNPTERVIMGTASFNVTPQKVGAYFNKIACFCFTEQILGPGETADMPVTFYVDPEIADDPNLDDVKTITLSYTFFEQEMDDDARAAHRTARLADERTIATEPTTH